MRITKIDVDKVLSINHDYSEDLRIRKSGEEFDGGYGLAIMDITDEQIDALRNGNILTGDILGEYVVAIRLQK